MNSYHLKVNNEVAIDFYTPIDKSERMRFLKRQVQTVRWTWQVKRSNANFDK